MNPLDTRPETVAMIGLGPSHYDYVSAAGCKKGFLSPDEVWGVNSTLDVFRLDKCFVMDDLKTVKKRYPDWATRIATTDTPVITSNLYPDLFPKAIGYPIDDVLKTIQNDYLTTTVAYMVAYAIHINVKEFYLFGMDFWYPSSQAREPGAEAVCFLLGMAQAKGINFRIPQNSTLMDSNMVEVKFNEDGSYDTRRPLYGFEYNPGDSKDRVERGQGTALDHQVVSKAPYMDKSIPKNMPKPDGQGDINGTAKESSHLQR